MSAPVLDLPRDTARIKEIFDSRSLEEHRQAQAEAEAILREIRESDKPPRWFLESGKHALSTVAWAFYLYGALYFTHIIVHGSHQQMHGFIADHQSNFNEGLGFIGTFHHGVCMVGAGCMGVLNFISPKLQPALEKYARKAAEAVAKNKIKISLPKHELATMLLTAFLFTTMNASIELNGYKIVQDYIFWLTPGGMTAGGQGPGHGNIDWWDFFSGETGLVVAYMARNLLLEKLNARAAKKVQTVDVSDAVAP